MFISTGTILLASPPVATSAGILQLTYGACLLSFSAGASCWGPAITGYKRKPNLLPPGHNMTLYSMGMVYPMIGCTALLSGPHWGMLALGIGFGLGSLVESYLDAIKRLPHWFMKVKTPITLATIVSLGLSYWFMPETIVTEIVAIIPEVAAEAISSTHQ